MNNTNKHISDEAIYVKFDPTGTNFSSDVQDVQSALGLLSPDAVLGTPLATEAVPGKIRIGTQEEVDNGILGDVAVTPKTLEFRLRRPQATTDVFGVTRFATNNEALVGLATDRTIVASSLKYVFDWTFANRLAKETKNGVVKLSTTPAAQAGVDDTTAMTPLKTKQAIAAATALIPSYGPATESTQGVVRLATLAQLRDPNIREGYSVSPFTLNQWQATEANIGAIKLASQANMDNSVANTAVTPAKFNSQRATTGRVGTTILADTIGDGSKALSGNARVLASDRAAVSSGGVYENNTNPNSKYITRDNLSSYMPVGAVIMTAFNSDHGNLFICNGRWLAVNEFRDLFNRIGYTYGGNGSTHFAIPDARGVAVRGFDGGRGLDSGRGFGTYQADMLASHEHQLQMILQSNGNIPSWQALYELKWAEKNDQQVYKFDKNLTKALPTGGHETRMKNIAFNYVICVK